MMKLFQRKFKLQLLIYESIRKKYRLAIIIGAKVAQGNVF